MREQSRVVGMTSLWSFHPQGIRKYYIIFRYKKVKMQNKRNLKEPNSSQKVFHGNLTFSGKDHI